MEGKFELSSDWKSKRPPSTAAGKTAPRPRRETKQQKDQQRRDRIASLTFCPALPEETHFRHSHWKHRRAKVGKILASCGASELAQKNWERCGSACCVMYSPSKNEFRLQANYCKSRHCQPCARAKANRICRNLTARLSTPEAHAAHQQGYAERFITVTLRHRHDRLAPLIAKLMHAFKKFRNSKAWKQTQIGGAAILEIKYTEQGWHPHLHIVSTGKFVNVKDLSAAWLEATGDSTNVDIRRMDRPTDAAHYLCKYITKGVPDHVWEDEDLAKEYVLAIKGHRQANTFGTWRGWQLTKCTCDVDDWKRLCPLAELLARAHNGEHLAQAILLQLRPPGDTDASKSARDPP